MFSKKTGIAVLMSASLSLIWSGSAFSANKEPVKIGLVTSVSGTFAPQGEEVQRAIKFAVKEANQKGGIDGRKVEVKLADDESTPEGARRGAEKLAREGYNLLIGPIASSMSLMLSQNLNRWDAAYFAILSKSDKLTGESCSPRMFRINPGDAMDLAMMTSWLKGVKEKKISILAADYAWGHDSADYLKKAAAKMGKEIKLELYAPMGNKDFAPYITQLNASGSEAVWVALVGRDIISFAKQAQEFGLKKKMRIVGHAYIFSFVINATGAASEGVWGNIGYNASIPTARNKQFVAAWKKEFKREPTENEGQAYNGIQAIFSGVKAAGSVKPEAVAKSLSGATVDTIFGPAKIRKEDHQMLLPNYIGQVKKVGGKYVPVITKTFDSSIIPPPSGACRMK